MEALGNGVVGAQDGGHELIGVHDRSDLTHEGTKHRSAGGEGVAGDAALLGEELFAERVVRLQLIHGEHDVLDRGARDGTFHRCDFGKIDSGQGFEVPLFDAGAEFVESQTMGIVEVGEEI